VASEARARGGRRVNTPLQFGQRCSANRSRHSAHHVHSNEQIHTFIASGAKSRSQHSQLGRISSTGVSVQLLGPCRIPPCTVGHPVVHGHALWEDLPDNTRAVDMLLGPRGQTARFSP
jgi:hypothetical protein